MKKVLKNSRVSAVIFILNIIVCMQGVYAQQEIVSNDKAKQELITLSKQKWQWMAEFNVDALSNLFHDKAVFVHMGATFTKNQELDVIRKKEIIYKHADIKEPSVQINGSTAILLNRIKLESIVGGNEVANPFVVAEIYVKEGNEWKLMAMTFTRQAHEYELNLDIPTAQNLPADVPAIKLNNGLEMPQFGLGTFNTPSNEVAKEAVLFAFKNGYRHVDTAHAYGNESAIGEAMEESGIPREEFWITSKLWPSDYANNNTLESIDKMLERLQTDYIDLLYIHQPVGDIVEAWNEMEKAVAAGKVRTLGISNFDYPEIDFHAFVESAKIKPAVLQIECHPYAQRKDMREKIKPYDIALECWYPLGSGDKDLLSDPVIKKIADTHGKSTAQVIIRWHIQEGFSVIPGATNPDYIKENIDVFDFTLSDDEMTAMRSLNKEKRFFNSSYEEIKEMTSNWILDN